MAYKKLTENQVEVLQKLIRGKKSSSKETRRAQTILMVNRKVDFSTIKHIANYGRRRVFDIRKSFIEKGLEGIKDKRKKKLKSLLTKGQRKEIIKVITTETPRNYGYDLSYWTTGILADLIELNYGVKYKSKSSYYIIFRESKFTYHKPGRVYHGRDEEEVKKWKKEIKPILEKAFQEKNTVVLTEDEMILSTQTTIQKVWLLKGEYPKITVSNNRKNRSIYGFLNVKTEDQHAFKTEKQNMYITCNILKKIRKIYPKNKIVLIWDNASWHRGSKVSEFLEKDKKIQTYYFPKYSPEENPQEHVWKEGRSQVTHNKFTKNIDAIADKFVEYLNKTKFGYSILKFSAKL